MSINIPPNDEADLIAKLKQKDGFAFSNLYDKYAPAIYPLVLQIVKNKETADNVLQKVFMVFWDTINQYEPAKRSLFTWMLQIVRSTAINEIKLSAYQETLKQASLGGEDALPVLSGSTIDSLGLKKITNNLEEENKTLFELYYYSGYNIEEIAVTLSIPEDTVKARIQTALLDLRNVIRFAKPYM